MSTFDRLMGPGFFRKVISRGFSLIAKHAIRGSRTGKPSGIDDVPCNMIEKRIYNGFEKDD